ncbi:MAG: sigma-70 family RNA polymerase sigma factor [Halanaerobiales bacterium]
MDTKNQQEYTLWKEYKNNNNQEIFQELVVRYLPLVKYHAGRIKMLVPLFIDEDDLISYGVLGLIDAINKFDIDKGVLFKTYASRRIRGEIIDHLRKLDWLPHSIRREGKRLKETADKLTKKLGRKPTVKELSEITEIPKDKIKALYQKIYSSQWLSLYDEFGDGRVMDILPEKDEKAPDRVYEDKEKEEMLTLAIDRLNEDEKLVIALVYYEELTQREVAEVMDLTPARISQIHKKAVYRLRGMLGKKKEALF